MFALEKRMGFSRKGKGQVSLEFMLIVGFAMLLSIPLIYIFFKQSESLSSEISGTQVDKIASEIRDAADEVYYLGAPSRKTITVYLPREIEAISIYGNSIVFNVSSQGSRYEVVKWSAANFSSLSSITPNPGIRKITVEAGAYEVLVTES